MTCILRRIMIPSDPIHRPLLVPLGVRDYIKNFRRYKLMKRFLCYDTNDAASGKINVSGTIIATEV